MSGGHWSRSTSTKFGLTLHPDKTRLIQFDPPDHRDDDDPPGTFDFLGFTHFWAKSRKDHWIVKRKTARSCFTRTLKAIGQWCR